MTAKSVLMRPKACAPGRVPHLPPPRPPGYATGDALRNIFQCIGEEGEPLRGSVERVG